MAILSITGVDHIDRQFIEDIIERNLMYATFNEASMSWELEEEPELIDELEKILCIQLDQAEVNYKTDKLF